MQNHSNKNCMILAQKQTWKPMEEKTQTQIHAAIAIWLLTRVIGEKIAPSTNGTGKTEYLPREDWN
jgi:hypothetical protein